MSQEVNIKAVIFDLGGVVLGSPLHAIERFERQRGIEVGFVNRQVMGSAPDAAWHRLERGELTLGPAFHAAFDEECRGAGPRFSSVEMFAEIAAESAPRPVMLEAIKRLRAAGLLVAALTNNWASDEGSRSASRGDERQGLAQHFDHFLESSVLGMRKPDPRIYRHACEVVGVALDQTAFLDDIGANLKSARALGMHTIKVVEPDDALSELGALVGLSLCG